MIVDFLLQLCPDQFGVDTGHALWSIYAVLWQPFAVAFVAGHTIQGLEHLQVAGVIAN